MIGFFTRSKITSNDLHHESDRVSLNCMIEAYKYAISHLPIHDPVFQHAKALQFDGSITAQFDSLVQRFESLKLKLEGSMDQLYDQFSEYQALDGAAFTLSMAV